MNLRSLIFACVGLSLVASVCKAQLPMIGTKYEFAQTFMRGKYQFADTIWSASGEGIESIAYAPFTLEGIPGALTLNFRGSMGKRYVSEIFWLHGESINSADLTARITRRPKTPFTEFVRSMKYDPSNAQYKMLYDALTSRWGQPWNSMAGSTLWLMGAEDRSLTFKNGTLSIAIFRPKNQVDTMKMQGHVYPPK